ncbi:uncharacterized protein LOC115033577 [Acyrthosiphon pisum]|uniref:Uncharacterized protein n=1 Tax=Acyrthosiphon pisum TaxID=7029 RepID=A0A8R2JMW2_ACYPI|nr:uncharacterized protein LOC115033577 [Acyrthosiphon pisum]
MFGTDMRVGLTTHFPSESVDKINTEDDLEIFLNNINVEEDVNAKYNIQVVNEASKDEGLCDLISIRQKSIDNNRKNSEICLINQAEKIKFRSIHKFPPANVGDSVRVTLPDVDSCAVVAIEDEQYNKLDICGGKNAPNVYIGIFSDRKVNIVGIFGRSKFSVESVENNKRKWEFICEINS